jgi:hypothetical protein
MAASNRNNFFFIIELTTKGTGGEGIRVARLVRRFFTTKVKGSDPFLRENNPGSHATRT